MAVRDRQRHDGRLRLDSQSKTPLLERSHHAVVAARSLWEDGNCGTIPNPLDRVFKAFLGFGGILALDRDVSTKEEMPTEEWNSVQGLLVQDAKGQGQIGEENRGIEQTLVIGGDDVSPARLEVRSARDRDLHHAGLENEPSPEARDSMGEGPAPEKESQQEGEASAHDRIDRDERNETIERPELRDVDGDALGLERRRADVRN